MEELKKCPFCGGEATTYKNKAGFFGVMCKDTPFCCTMTGYNTREKAIEAWNTRKPVERVIERLEAFKETHAKMWDVYDDEVSFGKMSAFHEAIEILKEEVG
jgi:hypothetical protein